MNYLKVIAIIYFVLTSVSTQAYSNDPNGEIFISRSFADFSNCGPIAALMLSKFSESDDKSKSLSESIKVARKIVQKNEMGDVTNRWWKTRDIKNYLKHQNIKYKTIDQRGKLTSEARQNLIINEINQGSVVVLNVNMNNIPTGDRFGKPYITSRILGSWGHFLIVVGYKKINGRLAYEIHDSFSSQGGNRLFYADHINKAIGIYNRELLFITKKKYSIDDLFELSFKENNKSIKS